jgi:hypothetical protein
MVPFCFLFKLLIFFLQLFSSSLFFISPLFLFQRCCYIMVYSAMPASENIARTGQCITPPVCHIRTVFQNLAMKKKKVIQLLSCFFKCFEQYWFCSVGRMTGIKTKYIKLSYLTKKYCFSHVFCLGMYTVQPREFRPFSTFSPLSQFCHFLINSLP